MDKGKTRWMVKTGILIFGLLLYNLADKGGRGFLIAGLFCFAVVVTLFTEDCIDDIRHRKKKSMIRDILFVILAVLLIVSGGHSLL
ncbi:hypothetical protein [Hornefia butyriciproducens]|uniref:hypothetical protein n=1 Tax=Hornefia butyriciproducens TaxID=2652293 RepID=UPI002A90FBF1|nr:hypothetical protein [Hornefia butyriciproducens]MCI7413827.1 hypothetical protein [Clostridiales bacterium]MDY6212474.1 hypothetical protein [Hornefia butyriciproducens]